MIPCNGSTGRTKACARPLHTPAGYLSITARPFPQCVCVRSTTANSLIIHTLLTNKALFSCPAGQTRYFSV